MGSDAAAIRDAATLVLVRDPRRAPHVLMGRRARNAVFMPDRFVFPGGAVDSADHHVPLADPVAAPCAARLGAGAGAFAATAIRELWEETGLVYGRTGNWSGAPPKGWTGFAASGHVPTGTGLRFVFRAVTPPGRPRRFDARFLMADAAGLAGDPDDFSGADGELADLDWIPLSRAADLHVPFITAIALAEIAALVPSLDAPADVPFIAQDGPRPHVERIR